MSMEGNMFWNIVATSLRWNESLGKLFMMSCKRGRKETPEVSTLLMHMHEHSLVHAHGTWGHPRDACMPHNSQV